MSKKIYVTFTLSDTPSLEEALSILNRLATFEGDIDIDASEALSGATSKATSKALVDAQANPSEAVALEVEVPPSVSAPLKGNLEGRRRFGRELFFLRESQGFTQAELGQLLGCHGSSISSYERGAAWMSGAVMQRYAKLFAYSPEDFMELRRQIIQGVRQPTLEEHPMS